MKNIKLSFLSMFTVSLAIGLVLLLSTAALAEVQADTQTASADTHALMTAPHPDQAASSVVVSENHATPSTDISPVTFLLLGTSSLAIVFVVLVVVIHLGPE